MTGIANQSSSNLIAQVTERINKKLPKEAEEMIDDPTKEFVVATKSH